MNGGKININVSGSANIGNVFQGDQNTSNVQEQSIQIDADKAFSEFFVQLEKLSASTKTHEQQISELRNDIVSLSESLDSSPKSKNSLIQLAQSLYEKYGWAADLLKKLFSVLIP